MSLLKPMPRPCNKGMLIKHLYNFNEHTVRADINEVIAEKRKISLKLAKNVKRLYLNEVIAVLKKYREID